MGCHHCERWYIASTSNLCPHRSNALADDEPCDEERDKSVSSLAVEVALLLAMLLQYHQGGMCMHYMVHTSRACSVIHAGYGTHIKGMSYHSCRIWYTHKGHVISSSRACSVIHACHIIQQGMFCHPCMHVLPSIHACSVIHAGMFYHSCRIWYMHVTSFMQSMVSLMQDMVSLMQDMASLMQKDEYHQAG
jgi:hypothetical protein